jgi:hypothetical protein
VSCTTYRRYRLSSVRFVMSPSFIAVHSDPSLEFDTLTLRVLSPIFLSKAKKTCGNKYMIEVGQCTNESSCSVEFDVRAIARALQSPRQYCPTTLMETTDVFRVRPFVIVTALSSSQYIAQFLNSRLAIVVLSINAVSIA